MNEEKIKLVMENGKAIEAVVLSKRGRLLAAGEPEFST